MVTNEGIPERLRSAREARRLSQREAAERIGVHTITYHRWEAVGIRPKSFGQLERAAEVLGVNVVWLATGKGPRLPAKFRPRPDNQ